MFGTFDPEGLVRALEILAVGWGGVFLVLAIIYLASLLLTKVFPADSGER